MCNKYLKGLNAFISSRAPIVVHALDEVSLRFQHHKPHKVDWFQLPPTRATNGRLCRSEHIKSLYKRSSSDVTIRIRRDIIQIPTPQTTPSGVNRIAADKSLGKHRNLHIKSLHISSRAPLLSQVLEEMLWTIQHHKPHREELGQAPPTRAKTKPQQNYTHQIPII